MIELHGKSHVSERIKLVKEELHAVFLAKLLSLNAAFEAARAGEAGAGFAAAAEEASSSVLMDIEGVKEGQGKR